MEKEGWSKFTMLRENPTGREKTMIVDLYNLTQHGMNFITIFVPKVILSKVYKLASIVAKRPIHCYWVHPAVL